MFNIISMKDTIKILPQYFDKDSEMALEAVENEILKKIRKQSKHLNNYFEALTSLFNILIITKRYYKIMDLLFAFFQLIKYTMELFIQTTVLVTLLFVFYYFICKLFIEN